MRKPVFAYLWPLYSDIICFIDHYCAGGQDCLLTFSFNLLLLALVCRKNTDFTFLIAEQFATDLLVPYKSQYCDKTYHSLSKNIMRQYVEHTNHRF